MVIARTGVTQYQRSEETLVIIDISEVTAVDDRIVERVRALLPQLSSSARAPSAADLRGIVESPATRLLVARDGDEIVGMLTLLTFAITSGVRSQIHDVVVAESARGRGIAEKLTRHALALARTQGADRVDLTSRPTREAANRLYPRIGFRRHETNLYRYTFDQGDKGSA